MRTLLIKVFLWLIAGFKMDMIDKRTSTRSFKNAEINSETIKLIISAGLKAPSPKNRQPWKYIVYAGESKEELLDRMELGLNKTEKNVPELAEAGSELHDAQNTLRIMREAPVIIAVLNTNGSSPFMPVNAGERITEICDSLSIGASIQNILLKAHESGIGTLWIANTFYAYGDLAEYIGTEHQLIGAIALGYPDEEPQQRTREPISEIIEFRY